MSILDLSKSLVDAVNSVIKADNEESVKLNEKIVKEGLSNFGVSSVSELSELDQKKLASWVQRKLEEASCCGCKNVDEESSAEDIVKSELKRLGKSMGELTPDEKKDLFNKVEAEVTAKNEGYGKDVKEVLDLTSGTEEEAIKRAIDDFLKSDAPQFDGKSKDEIIDMAVAAVKQARGTSKKDVKEGIETDPEDIATNGAVGVTDPEEQMPVAVDVIKEVDTEGGDKREVHYRLFVQFNVNDLPKIVPPPSLPGAKSIEDLRDLVSGLPYYGEKVEDALASASEAEVAKM